MYNVSVAKIEAGLGLGVWSRWLSIGAALGLVLLAACASPRAVERKEAADVAVSHLLDAIDDAAHAAYERYGDSFELHLVEASVELSTTLARTQTGELELLVLSIERAREVSSTQTVTVSLLPPAKRPAGSVEEHSAHPELIPGLTDAFHSALLAARGAHQGLRTVHPEGIPLEASTVDVSVSFTLSTTSEGNLSITVGSITPYLASSAESSGLHKISLRFSVPTGLSVPVDSAGAN